MMMNNDHDYNVNNNDDDIKRCDLRFGLIALWTVSSTHSHMAIVQLCANQCKTLDAYHVQTCHVVQRDSPAVDFGGAELAFSFVSLAETVNRWLIIFYFYPLNPWSSCENVDVHLIALCLHKTVVVLYLFLI